MRIHLVGVCGISMRGLARYLVDSGNEVTGCDVNPNEFPGFPVLSGHTINHIHDVDQLIINSAITQTHPGWVEVQAARRSGLPILKRAQKIGQMTRERPTSAITGTHGKSTTTGMMAKVALEAKLDPFVMIGAPVADFGGQTYRQGAGPLILEADEFDRSFLQFTVQTGIVNNIEADHLDYYTGGLPEIIDTFAEFMRRIVPGGMLILNGDDQNVLAAYQRVKDELGDRIVRTFGRSEQADYQIIAHQPGPKSNRFSIRLPTHQSIDVSLCVPGHYNQENATAVYIAATEALELSSAHVVRALEAYNGVGWRFQRLAETDKATIIMDYGHHPTEIRVTIEAAQTWFENQRLTVIFQPHQYARTKLLFDDFVAALGHAPRVFITDIYGVSGREDGATVSSEHLVESLTARGKDAHYIPVSQILPVVQTELTQGGVFLLMGAGLDIRHAAERLAEYLLGSYESRAS